MLIVFSGCAVNRAPESASSGQPGAARLPDGAGGVYKTGNPYRIAGRWYTPMQTAAAYDRTGIASWYGRDFHNKRTANGEIYDMHALSAAHTTLPLPTLVRVTNMENGRSVVVRVNDRGPFAKDRLIDLSYAAARELGFVRQGTARVRVQTLDLPASQAETASAPAAMEAAPDMRRSPPATGGIYVQLGAFGSRDNAERLRSRLLDRYPAVRLHPMQVVDTLVYRVRIGPFSRMQHIEQTLLSLQDSGFNQAIVVIE